MRSWTLNQPLEQLINGTTESLLFLQFISIISDFRLLKWKVQFKYCFRYISIISNFFYKIGEIKERESASIKAYCYSCSSLEITFRLLLTLTEVEIVAAKSRSSWSHCNCYQLIWSQTFGCISCWLHVLTAYFWVMSLSLREVRWRLLAPRVGAADRIVPAVSSWRQQPATLYKKHNKEHQCLEKLL